ncbi:MAG: Gfo/Idh/MocA family oxidoreductase [Candidatus Azambacteria bacterium]|nr:Gfo/Idh/MocA family oxidoreductase [Candidatus Azambacteria bacterium]
MSHKILIVGVGSIGTRHLKNLLKLGYKNLAVCESDEKKLKAVAELSNFALYKNVKIALKKEMPDVVFVCNPTHLHVPTASLALDSGAHVFIEKPLSHNLVGVDALIKKAKTKKRIVMVACNFRFHFGIQKLKKALDGGKFGKPVLARIASGYYLPTARKNINYKKNYAAGTKGGGVILDSGAHVLNYLEYLFGKAKGFSSLKSLSGSLGIKSEEAAMLAFEHENKVISTAVMDYVSRKPINRIEVVMEKGLLTLDVNNNILRFDGGAQRSVLYKGNSDLNRMFIEEVKHFFRCVNHGAEPAQDLKTAKETLKTLLLASNIKAKEV